MSGRKLLDPTTYIFGFWIPIIRKREQGCEDPWLFFETKRGSRGKNLGKHCHGEWTSIQSAVFVVRLLEVVASVTKRSRFRRQASILFHQSSCLLWLNFLYFVSTCVLWTCSPSLQPAASRLKLWKALSNCEWMTVFDMIHWIKFRLWLYTLTSPLKPEIHPNYSDIWHFISSFTDGWCHYKCQPVSVVYGKNTDLLAVYYARQKDTVWWENADFVSLSAVGTCI